MSTMHTHISVILDRSGSMSAIRNDTIGGFNNFLGEQQKLPDKATLTLIQFDTMDPYEVICHFKPLSEVSNLTYETFAPRGATPLLDALGRGISDLETSIAKMRKEERPDKVMMVVVTDGEENASREFSKRQVEEMINERSKKDNWQFVFLSSDMNAIREARGLGFAANSTLSFSNDAKGVGTAWHTISETSARYRAGSDHKVDLSKTSPKR